MNYRTQDVIVWDGFPHPDPRSRHGEASVRIAPSFWSRLAQHVRDARPARLRAPCGKTGSPPKASLPSLPEPQ